MIVVVILVCLFAPCTLTVLAIRELRPTRRLRREQAEWASFRHGNADLDQALDEVWNRREDA
jgi:hypothetical protein